MSFLSRTRKQTATHWQKTGVDSAGDPEFASPTTLSVRWEDRLQNVKGPDGTTFQSRSMIFLGQTVAVGDYLLLGTSTASDPVTVDGAYEVKGFNTILGIRTDQIEYKAFI